MTASVDKDSTTKNTTTCYDTIGMSMVATLYRRQEREISERTRVFINSALFQ